MYATSKWKKLVCLIALFLYSYEPCLSYIALVKWSWNPVGLSLCMCLDPNEENIIIISPVPCFNKILSCNGIALEHKQQQQHGHTSGYIFPNHEGTRLKRPRQLANSLLASYALLHFWKAGVTHTMKSACLSSPDRLIPMMTDLTKTCTLEKLHVLATKWFIVEHFYICTIEWCQEAHSKQCLTQQQNMFGM